MMRESQSFADAIEFYNESRILTAKINAFKIIYTTMQKCQNNFEFLKTNFLEGKEDLPVQMLQEQIEVHIKLNPNSRTQKAWELTEKHYKNCDFKNTELFNEIYQYVCKNQTFLGTTFFSQLKTPVALRQQDIANPNCSDKTVRDIRFWLEALRHDQIVQNSWVVKYPRIA